MTSDVYALWTSLPEDQLTAESVQEFLRPIRDDLWVAAACSDRLVDDVDVQRQLLELGLERTEHALGRCKETAVSVGITDDEEQSVGDVVAGSAEARSEEPPLASYLRQNTVDAQLCHLRAVLLRRLDRLNTYVEMCTDMPEHSDPESDDDEDVDMAEWEDDPWEDDGPSSGQSKKPSKPSSHKPPLPLSNFLTGSLLRHCCYVVSNHWFSALPKLFQRHGEALWRYRLAILEYIPDYAPAQSYREILPSFDAATEKERVPVFTPWRAEADWTEQPDVLAALKHCGLSVSSESDKAPPNAASYAEPLSCNQLTDWYQARANDIIDNTGMVDTALSMIQHGASQGIPGLDEMGEELSLFTRLVYDTPRALSMVDEDSWTFSRWLSMDPTEIISAYTAHSTTETIVNDIRRLVMPYLFVLEARRERSGSPDPELPDRLLRDYILKAPIDIAACIFEASKPTLPPAERLIRDDEDIARLALASLYGSTDLHNWATMSRIFECLPAWDIPRDEDTDGDIADTTMASLGDFVTPTASKPRCTSNDLLMFFQPLPLSSLSRALDILDVHLESGEILSRWGVPAPLRWFLQSNGKEAEQRAWANRMARRSGETNNPLNSLEDWEWLLEDMLKLTGRGENGIRGAFGLIHRKDVMKIFLSGLLSTGKFDIAKSLIHSKRNKFTLKPDAVEEICVTSSHEFYDNASTGNYKVGDMKLAYDCLDVPAQSDRIQREREFIEATSRLSSFNIMSRGNPITPIEIRLTKDRLSLVSNVLSSNSDAYKHTEVILDLVHKLGFKNDPVAEVKVLSMISETALLAEDFTRAYEIVERMVGMVLRLSDLGISASQVKEASDVCWVACFQLGRQPEFDDVGKKMSLLGRALELCPPSQLNDVLNAWRRLEKEDIENREQRLANKDSRKKPSTVRKDHTLFGGSLYNAHQPIQSLAARLQDLRMPTTPLLNSPDAAAFASSAFRSVAGVAANFPSFGRGSHQSSQRGEEHYRGETSPRLDGSDVSAQASRVLSKGIGWLIGDE